MHPDRDHTNEWSIYTRRVRQEIRRERFAIVCIYLATIVGVVLWCH